MFNPFKVNEQDVEQLFKAAGEELLINDEPMQAIVTNSAQTPTNIAEDRTLHTLEHVGLGDQVVYQDAPYMVIAENISKRHLKYVSRIRHCNRRFEFENIIGQEIIGTDPETGRPIYEYIYGEPYVIFGIVNNKTFSIDERYAVRVVSDEIELIVPDNEITREKLGVNETFEALYHEWQVLGHDYTQKGIINMGCERGMRIDE